MFSKLWQMTIKFYAKGNKRKVLEISVLYIFKLMIEKKKNSQRKSKSLACPNRRMHYNTKYYCISNTVLH